MYGNDTSNIGMNISAGTTGGIGAIALTQDVLLALICVFAILSLATVYKVISYSIIRPNPVPVRIDTSRGG